MNFTITHKTIETNPSRLAYPVSVLLLSTYILNVDFGGWRGLLYDALLRIYEI